MPENRLYPSFVKIDYHTKYAPHVQIIPTRQIQGIGGPVGSLFFETWGGGSVPATDMINDFVDLLAPFQDADCDWDLMTFFNVPTVDGPSQPVGIAAIVASGTNVGTGVPAAQSNFTFRTDAFGLLKIVLLDTIPTVGFLPVNPVGAGTPIINLQDFMASDDTAFQGRDGGRPTVFSRATYTLNEKLRKEYNLV